MKINSQFIRFCNIFQKNLILIKENYQLPKTLEIIVYKS